MEDHLRLEIAELEAHGLSARRPFTIQQARDAGISRGLLRRLVADGSLRRLFRGVYVDNGSEDTPQLRAKALSLVLPAGSVAVDHTAAWMSGVDTFSPLEHVIPPPLSIDRIAGAARIRRQGCAGGERQLSTYDVTNVAGVSFTTPLRTALDLGRRLPRERALAALDALARSGTLGRPQLEASIPRFKGFRGIVQLRSLVPLVDAAAESPGESRLRLAWIDAELPPPVLQQRVSGNGREAYLDLCDPASKFAAEYDGQEWHSSPQQRAHDLQRRAWLEAQGWKILVFTKHDFRPDGSAATARLRREFFRANRAVA